jgi:hypothetical protein
VSQLSLSLGCAASSLRNQELFGSDEKLKTRDTQGNRLKEFDALVGPARCAIKICAMQKWCEVDSFRPKEFLRRRLHL